MKMINKRLRVPLPVARAMALAPSIAASLEHRAVRMPEHVRHQGAREKARRLKQLQ